MDINKLIAFRRAVYPSQFNKGEIDKATLDQLLENANMAPTHKMTQPWFFKVYKNKAKARNYWKKIKLMEEDSRNRGRKY